MSDLKVKVRTLISEIKARFIGNEKAVEVAVLNQLHRRSATLIRAPRGAGKSTLMLLLLRGLCGDDFIVVSGASEVRRGEVIGRLHIPSLEREGVERIVWSEFVKSRGKGLDEVNRLNPYTTAGIYHLMQFGEVWSYGKRLRVGDYILIANENPNDVGTFIHPPPFYDRFDICILLRTLSLSEKFKLEEALKKFKGSLVESMPQILDVNELDEIRREVSEIELDIETLGMINMIVRDLQACIRDKEFTDVKPPALCSGCHFVKETCSKIKEPPSERSVISLTELAKAKLWLDGELTDDSLWELVPWTLIHRASLTDSRNILGSWAEILSKEREKVKDREARGHWLILLKLSEKFDQKLYSYAKELSLEDPVFAEELRRLEEKWSVEGILKDTR
ncbi:MAG: AAA family ATPase [Candidatus Bathyarchaeia archaeon]